MSRRSFLYHQLRDDTLLHSYHQGRVFQDSAMTTPKVDKPFLVYHMGNNTSENLAEDHPASRLFFQVYVHDDRGDYGRIDDIGDRVKALLMGTTSKANEIINTRFLERSQDLADDSLHTIFAYLRFQWVLGK